MVQQINGTEIIRRECGNAQAILLKGHDSTGQEKQLAMTIYDGWKHIDWLESQGTNPESEKSIVVYATAEFEKHYGSYEPYVMISQVITKENHVEFTEEELFPIASVEYEDSTQTGAYGTVTLHMKDGSRKCVNFDGIEARLTL